MTFSLASAWTEERVARLEQLWAQGLSCSQISRDLGGITRNAVIGKVHRLHLAGRVPRVNQVKGIPRRRKPKVTRYLIPYAGSERVIAVKRPAPVEPIPLRLPLFDLTEHTCKYAVTDDLPHAFCGHPSTEGWSWCEYHKGICFNEPQSRRRAA